MNNEMIQTAAAILENFKGETRELPEGFVKLGVCVTCPNDETFDAAVDYLLDAGLLESTIVQGGGRFIAALRAA